MQPNLMRSVLALAALFTFAHAQDGVSTAGAARARYLSNLGVLPASREIAVEDFVNYHRHEIGRPKAGEAVGLDLRWANASIARGGEAVLQIGLSTTLAHDRQKLRPLNLSLVIDKSGSMAESDKLTRVKAALTTLVSQLRSTDVLSIVAFDSEAVVLVPAEPIGDKARVEKVIREIEPSSATNLEAGLRLGYEQCLTHRKDDATNRVILLTDGIANRGVTDSQLIARTSISYNDRGIDLSTIGVGLDLNKDLLRDLAKSGRGLFHFVADGADIQKVFDNEVQSLVSSVASEPNLVVEFGSGLRPVKVFGYEPRIDDHTVTVRLPNMNSGLTEVVLVRVKADRSDVANSGLPVKVRLTYHDLELNKDVVASADSSIPVKSGDQTAADPSVTKNVVIATLAQAIKDMATDCEAGKFGEARTALRSAIAETNRQYPSLGDEDVHRTVSMAAKYLTVVRARLSDSDEDEPSLEGNLIPNGDFALGARGFSSDLSYVAPSDNCLWAGGYTVAPKFNGPQLHRLIASEEYTAPVATYGNEQVMYANLGGTDSFLTWTTKVSCQPKTKYSLSFQAISLTPGQEWVPTFEIRVNGERSEPQVAGAGQYKEVTYEWASKGAKEATVSIVRLPIPHGGGIVGLANIAMRQIAAR